ncbi:hypothetical protein EJB05_01157, partial [Eragrostis curvula]
MPATKRALELGGGSGGGGAGSSGGGGGQPSPSSVLKERCRSVTVKDGILDLQGDQGVQPPAGARRQLRAVLSGSKKHAIPLLNDDVWCLKKISKDGVFHKALRGAKIFCVKDFLRLYYKDEQSLRLRNIIGVTFGDNYTPFSDLDKCMKDLVEQWSKVRYKNLAYHQPADYELDNGIPRSIHQVSPPQVSMGFHIPS